MFRTTWASAAAMTSPRRNQAVPPLRGRAARSSPARAVPGREVWLARTVVPSAPGAGVRATRSERRQTPAGRTPPPAGPGTAVRPPSRGREGRRPRDGRRTPALATAHPAGLNCGPARRVRLSQIPASRTALEERAPPLNARAGESPLSTLTAPAENAASPQAGTSSHHHRRARRGHRSLRPAGLNAGAENHRLVD